MRKDKICVDRGITLIRIRETSKSKRAQIANIIENLSKLADTSIITDNIIDEIITNSLRINDLPVDVEK
jgi:TolB-like protein